MSLTVHASNAKLHTSRVDVQASCVDVQVSCVHVQASCVDVHTSCVRTCTGLFVNIVAPCIIYSVNCTRSALCNSGSLP